MMTERERAKVTDVVLLLGQLGGKLGEMDVLLFLGMLKETTKRKAQGGENDATNEGEAKERRWAHALTASFMSLDWESDMRTSWSAFQTSFLTSACSAMDK